MSIVHGPLETLPPAVERAAGSKAPAPMRLMAARGLAPLGPVDLVTALYHLAHDEDETLKKAAMKSAAELPEKILGGALDSPLDPRLLDFFGRRLIHKQPLLEKVLLNRQTDNDTFVFLAKMGDEAATEMIAKNEERLLRCPPIIAALYLNAKTRMSTAQRAVELAIRNDVTVEGIPSFEETKKALAEGHGVKPTDDEAFKQAGAVVLEAAGPALTALDPEEQRKLDAILAEQAEQQAEGASPEAKQEGDEKRERIDQLSVVAKIRLATLGNAFARSILIRDRNKQVSSAAIRSPAISESEVVHYAQNRSLDEDIIRYISNKRTWVRLYSVKFALCNNPKCPLPTAMRFLPHLRIPDLKALSRSKGIPSSLATAAKQLSQQRQ